MASLLLRRARAAGTDGSRLRVLGTQAVGLDKAIQVGIVGAVEGDLLTPGRGHHGGFEAGIGADEYVGPALGDVLQLCYLILREVGGEAIVDCTVLY